MEEDVEIEVGNNSEKSELTIVKRTLISGLFSGNSAQLKELIANRSINSYGNTLKYLCTTYSTSLSNTILQTFVNCMKKMKREKRLLIIQLNLCLSQNLLCKRIKI